MPASNSNNSAQLTAEQTRVLTSALRFPSETAENSTKYSNILYSLTREDQNNVFGLSKQEQLNFAKKVESGLKSN